jgi:hypothetical protein
MSTSPPGYVTFRVSHALQLATARNDRCRVLQKWAAAELLRRRLLIREQFLKLSGVRKFFSRSPASHITPDGGLERGTPFYVCWSLGPHDLDGTSSVTDLGFSTTVDYDIADGWVRRLQPVSEHLDVLINADDAMYLGISYPTALRFKDINWASLRLPVLPPQPPVPLPE